MLNLSETKNSSPQAGGSRELLKLAAPLVLSQSFMTVQIFLDTLLLSWHSPEEMAASFPAVMWFWTLFRLPASHCRLYLHIRRAIYGSSSTRSRRSRRLARALLRAGGWPHVRGYGSFRAELDRTRGPRSGIASSSGTLHALPFAMPHSPCWSFPHSTVSSPVGVKRGQCY